MYLSTKSLCRCEQSLRRYTTLQRFLGKQLLTHAIIYLSSFQHLWKALQMFSLKRASQKTFFIPKFVAETINK